MNIVEYINYIGKNCGNCNSELSINFSANTISNQFMLSLTDYRDDCIIFKSYLDLADFPSVVKIDNISSIRSLFIPKFVEQIVIDLKCPKRHFYSSFEYRFKSNIDVFKHAAEQFCTGKYTIVNNYSISSSWIYKSIPASLIDTMSYDKKVFKAPLKHILEWNDDKIDKLLLLA